MFACLLGVGFPPEAYYTEKTLIGYRWYDFHGVTPAYCFGHGLSFTKFSYSSVKTSAPSSSGVVQVDIEVTNVGSFTGSEVVQLYLSFPTSVQGEPKRQLKGLFKLRDLAPGSAQTVSFVLTERDVSIWDESVSDWRVTPGQFTVFVGASSCDLSHSTTFVI
jgi:beta-glucosidase